MVSDGEIDQREINTIKNLCEKSPLFENFDYKTEINSLIEEINQDFRLFISEYFRLLKETDLDEKSELDILDFAIKTIYTDDKVAYSEVKFFKNIRHRLNIEKGKLLEIYPEIEEWLEDDIKSEFYLDEIKQDYFNTLENPSFDIIDNIEGN